MMHEPLFYEPEPFPYLEKLGGEVDLPDDPNQWPQAILQELYKQVPYISDYQPHVEMKRVDAERGYGLGHVEIRNHTEAPQESTSEELSASGVRTVRIPFVIKENKLSPFDLLMNDQSKMVPLTENRLRTALFRPQAFDVTSRTPGDQSMIGQLYPPYRQNYGFGGGGVSMNASGGMAMGKLGSALEDYLTPRSLEEKNKLAARVPVTRVPIPPKKYASILDSAIAGMSQEDKESFVRELNKSAHYLETNRSSLNRQAAASLDKILEADPFTYKLASWTEVTTPSVVQVTRHPEGYLVKMASHLAWDPRMQVIDRGTLVRNFGEKLAMDVDTSGGVTVQNSEEEPPPGEEEETNLGPMEQFGMYKVTDATGKEHVGFVIPSLIDVSGDDVPIKLFTNGSVVAVQADMVGEPAGTGANLPSAPISGEGVFWGMSDDGTVKATIPFKFQNSQSVAEEPTVYNGETFDGAPAQVSVQPNIVTPIGQGGKLLVPESWSWMPLDGAQTIMVLGDEEQTAAAKKEPKKEAQVVIRSDGMTFSFEGAPVEKLGYDQTKFLDVGDAMFLLAGLGVNQVTGTEKLAQAIQGGASPAVQVGRQLTLDSEMRKQASAWRAEVEQFTRTIRQPHLIKEAVSIPDPTTVDTVLSLGFVNPDNLMNYVSYLPDMDDVQSKLCELLFGVRLGIANVPQSAVERAVRSLEEVIEGLKIVAFQGS